VSTLKRSRTGSDRLLVHHDRTGWHPPDAQDVNDRLRELTGDDFTVRDLRTWNATILAGRWGDADKRAAIRVMFDEVSAHLGNTPAVARNSYVDPTWCAASNSTSRIRLSTDLGRVERAVAPLLGKVDRATA
jgi:DNA topoisomerase-1